MSRIKITLVAFGSFFALFAFAPSASYAQGVKPPADVSVVNTPSVTVVGTPAVQVGNTSANPVAVRDVDNAARQPFSDQVILGTRTSFTVPQGKRLVIEYVSGLATITGGQKFKLIGLRCTALFNGGVLSPIGHLFTPVFMAKEGNAGNLQVDSYSISQQTRLYVEPGGTVELFVVTIPGDAQSAVVISVSGYLVDVQ